MRKRDWPFIWMVIGLVVMMFVGVIGLSQIEGRRLSDPPWGAEPDWQRAIYIVDGAAVCPTLYGIQAYFERKTMDCFHRTDRNPVKVMEKTEHWVRIRFTNDEYGWTWWGQLTNDPLYR